MGKRAMLMGAAGAIGLAALASPALAQNAEVSEEIVVTAQKREENIFDVPLAVQALGAEQLENAGVSNVADLTTLIPGASVVSSNTPGFDTIQIRGISSGTTGDGLVGYYVDETPFGIPNLQLSPPAGLLDVARVEVIRGPSGTLYGQGSMGGTIKLVTARPDSTAFSGQIEAQGSTTEGGGDNYSVSGVVNIPVVRDRFAVRIAAAYDELGGYAEFDDLLTLTPDGDDVNDFTGVNVRATALWTPTPDLSVSGMYWRIDNQQGANNSLDSLVPNAPTIRALGRGPGFTNVDMDLYSLTLDWDTAIGTLTSNSSYVDHTLDYDVPFVISFVNDSTFDTTSFTQELRLASNGEGPLSWLVGGFFRDATIDSDICVYTTASCGPLTSLINIVGPLDTTSWSVFGEASLELFGGKLVPLVGLRYFEDDRSARGIDRNTLVASNTSASWDSLSPRFNLTYNASDDLLFYFNAANGFRSGALQTPSQATAANAALGLPPGTIGVQIDPDELWTYEFGGRWRSADRTFTLEASVYRTDWSDIQTQFASAAVVSVANAGEAEITGLDVGVLWRATDSLSFRLVGNVNNAEITSAPAALSAATAIDPGERMPNVPGRNYTISADYERDVSLLGGSVFSLYGGYAYRDEQIDATTGARSGELNDLTLRAGIERGNWRLQVFALNALDDVDPSSVAPASLVYQILYPRRVGVSLGVDF